MSDKVETWTFARKREGNPQPDEPEDRKWISDTWTVEQKKELVKRLKEANKTKARLESEAEEDPMLTHELSECKKQIKGFKSGFELWGDVPAIVGNGGNGGNGGNVPAIVGNGGNGGTVAAPPSDGR